MHVAYVVVARPFFGGVAIRYVLPVLWMFHIMSPVALVSTAAAILTAASCPVAGTGRALRAMGGRGGSHAMQNSLVDCLKLLVTRWVVTFRCILNTVEVS